MLGAIGDEVHRHAAAARDGVIADFAGRLAHARKHLSRDLLAATLATIKDQRKTALVSIKRNAALELAGRKKVAIDTFRLSQPRRGENRRNPNDPPTLPPHGS